MISRNQEIEVEARALSLLTHISNPLLWGNVLAPLRVGGAETRTQQKMILVLELGAGGLFTRSPCRVQTLDIFFFKYIASWNFYGEKEAWRFGRQGTKNWNDKCVKLQLATADFFFRFIHSTQK